MADREPRQPRSWLGISWTPVLFLVLYLAMLGLLSHYLLLPMLHAASAAPPDQRRKLSAYALLLMFLLLLILMVGLVMTLRPGTGIRRMLLGRHTPTEYPDAWEESARRTRIPDARDLEPDNPADGADHDEHASDDDGPDRDDYEPDEDSRERDNT